ncbi:MAG: hypothetical protein NXI13_07055 [Proteobacteria bacterium]|nr:hypothetical protein [Pseudomonadota bacterium]
MKSEDSKSTPEPILKPGKGPFLSPEKTTISIRALLALVSLLVWPVLALAVGLGAHRASSLGFKEFTLTVIFYYPIPVITGVVGEAILRKMYHPADILFTWLAFGSLLALILSLVILFL